MPRYIDADALLDEIPPGKIVSSDSMRCKIITAPTADVREVNHGHWIKNVKKVMHGHWIKTKYTWTVCSNCLSTPKMYFPFNYCPYCGAIMDEKEKEE